MEYFIRKDLCIMVYATYRQWLPNTSKLTLSYHFAMLIRGQGDVIHIVLFWSHTWDIMRLRIMNTLTKHSHIHGILALLATFNFAGESLLHGYFRTTFQFYFPRLSITLGFWFYHLCLPPNVQFSFQYTNPFSLIHVVEHVMSWFIGISKKHVLCIYTCVYPVGGELKEITLYF